MDERTLARFWSKVRVTAADECWEWLAYRQRYGRIGFRGRLELAHRVSWILTYGEIPSGAHVLHRCDNTGCCNPGHLFLGTHTDNMRDKSAKGRSWRGGAKHPRALRGETNGFSKLTAEQVIQIRAKRAGGATLVSIAREFSVTIAAIHSVVTRKNWRHVA